MESDWNRKTELKPAEEGFRRFKITLSYDGTSFWGWQRQSATSRADLSVQSFVENAIYRISGEYVNVYGSGRTDSGVHALAQCAHFDSSAIKMPADKLRLALNANLPPAIRISDVQERYDSFHARFSTFLRTYVYRIKDDRSFSAFDSNRVWRILRYPEIGLLNSIAALVIGENRDFFAFDFTKGDVAHSTKRDILQSVFFMEGGALSYRITGNAFLYHMVRALVGTFVTFAVKYGDDAVVQFLKLLEDREKCKFIAPACGLYLERIIYERSEYLEMLGNAKALK